MEGLTTAIILILIVVGVILAVYFGRRYQAKKILLIASPTVKKSIKWKTSQLSFNGMEGTPVKFSNRVKAHAWVASLNGLTIRAATIINKKIYAKMISLGELHSVPEVLKIIENEEKAQSIQIQSQPKKQDNYDETQGVAS